MAQFPGIRQRVIARLYGDGFGAMVAAGVIDRAITQLRHAVRKEPETIDVSKLVPGESYIVSTRPAPTRKERKLERDALAAHLKLEKALRPSRSTRRLERQLAKNAVTATTAEVGSKRWAKAVAQIQVQEPAVEARLRPSAKARRLRAKAALVDAQLDRRRSAALLKARKKARPPRSRVYR